MTMKQQIKGKLSELADAIREKAPGGGSSKLTLDGMIEAIGAFEPEKVLAGSVPAFQSTRSLDGLQVGVKGTNGADRYGDIYITFPEPLTGNRLVGEVAYLSKEKTWASSISVWLTTRSKYGYTRDDTIAFTVKSVSATGMQVKAVNNSTNGYDYIEAGQSLDWRAVGWSE